MISRSSNHWKFWLVLFPIIGTCALANFPGGMKGFFSAWYGGSTDTARGFLQHFWNPATLNENDQIGSLNATSVNFDPDTTNGWSMLDINSRYVTLGGPISNGTSYSITCWIKPDLTAMNQNGFGGWIASDRTTSSGTQDYQLLYDKIGLFAMTAITTNNLFIAATITNRIHDAWQHIAGVVSWSGSTGTVQIYHNGTAGTSAALTNAPNDKFTGSSIIGANSWDQTPDTKYHGSIGKVRFYNRALTATEVQREYERDVTGP